MTKKACSQEKKELGKKNKALRTMPKSIWSPFYENEVYTDGAEEHLSFSFPLSFISSSKKSSGSWREERMVSTRR